MYANQLRAVHASEVARYFLKVIVDSFNSIFKKHKHLPLSIKKYQGKQKEEEKN